MVISNLEETRIWALSLSLSLSLSFTRTHSTPYWVSNLIIGQYIGKLTTLYWLKYVISSRLDEYQMYKFNS